MPVRAFLENIYPGNSPTMIRLRADIERYSSLSGPAAVLLLGPPGVGKTTAARALAVARALLILDNREGRITTNRAEDLVLRGKSISWYRDISLAGLNEELADTSLFGITPKGATDVGARIGIFEQAMTNPSPRDPELPHKKLLERAKSSSAWTPLLTGGVVLLDEIADAPEWLQLKLLRLLNGERVYRVRGEGEDDWSFTFSGLVVLATWKNVDNNPALRPDLLQRIGQFRIELPSLSDYPVESRERIIDSVIAGFQRRSQEELERIDQLGADSFLNSAWRQSLDQAKNKSLLPAQRAVLASLDWEAHDQFRGLIRALRLYFAGVPFEEIVESAQRAGNPKDDRHDGFDEDDLDRLFRYLDANTTISRGWLNDRSEWGRRVLDALKGNHPRIEAYIRRTGRNRRQIDRDIRNALRSG